LRDFIALVPLSTYLEAISDEELLDVLAELHGIAVNHQ
jgi:hypothetical protein